MKISMIATVALLSLLAVASSAPHGRRYYQLLIDALEQQDDPGIIMYIILPIGTTKIHEKLTCTINLSWFTCMFESYHKSTLTIII